MGEAIYKCQRLSGSILETWALYKTRYRKDTCYWFKLFLLYCYLKYNKHCDTLSRIIMSARWVAWAISKKGPGVSASPPLPAAPFLWRQGLDWPLQTIPEIAGARIPSAVPFNPSKTSFTYLPSKEEHPHGKAPPRVHQITLALAFLSMGWWEKGDPVPSLIVTWPR